jgi:hypothetical protein
MDHYTFLVEDTETEDTLLSYLLQYEVLDEQETAKIRALAVSQKRNVKLLDFVMRTTSAQYDKFLEALVESKQEHVCNELLGFTGNTETLPSASADEVDNCDENVLQTSVKHAASIKNIVVPSRRVKQAESRENVLTPSLKVKQGESREKGLGQSLEVKQAESRENVLTPSLEVKQAASREKAWSPSLEVKVWSPSLEVLSPSPRVGAIAGSALWIYYRLDYGIATAVCKLSRNLYIKHDNANSCQHKSRPHTYKP